MKWWSNFIYFPDCICFFKFASHQKPLLKRNLLDFRAKIVSLDGWNTFFQLDVIIFPGREAGICLHLWETTQQQYMAACFFSFQHSGILFPKVLWPILWEMVFCYQNCSGLLWEKTVIVIEKNFWNQRLKAKNF